MKITGKNLVLLRYLVELAQAELRNQVGSCPNVFEHEDMLEELEEDLADSSKLLARIDKEIEAKGLL